MRKGRTEKLGSTVLIVKGTRLCNLRCSYCHDWRAGDNQIMNFKVMSKMISSVLTDDRNDMVEFIWHGGEPTLLPLSFYEKALYVQSRFQRKGQIVINMIQTNGTEMSEQWAKFLSFNKFIVGISLDGPPEINDRFRKFESGKPSSEDILNTISTLKDYQVPFSVLMVVDEAAIQLGASRIFKYFVNNDILNFGFLAATPINQPNTFSNHSPIHYINSNQMNSFLIDMYDCWREYKDPKIKIREIESVISGIKGRHIHCTLAGNCFGKYFMVEPNGDVSHCDLFVGDSSYVLGNILENDFKTMGSGEKIRSLEKENNLSLERMKPCAYFRVCNGWCPHQTYLSIRHNPNHKDYCCGLFELIDHISKNLPDFI